MISSLARGGAVLQEDCYINAAQQAARFVLAGLKQEGRLPRSITAGRISGPGFLDDYAFLLLGSWTCMRPPLKPGGYWRPMH